jgi:hypothetical protein
VFNLTNEKSINSSDNGTKMKMRQIDVICTVICELSLHLFIPYDTHISYVLTCLFYLIFIFSLQLLRQSKPDAKEEWKKKQPSLAHRLEVSLYHSASSIDDFMDVNTLQSRMNIMVLSQIQIGSISPLQINKDYVLKLWHMECTPSDRRVMCYQM